jgi:tetratricopeptide (TPR) repeat protein
MRLTRIFLVGFLVCCLFQLALGQKAKKRKLPASTYKTTAKIFLKDEYRMYDSAIVKLKEGISFYPDDAELHFLLGKVYYTSNMPREMGEQFTLAESLKIKSKFREEIEQMRTEKWSEVYNQAVNAFNEQDFDLALEKFVICAILDPQDYRGFMQAGYAHSLKGENDEAMSYLEKAIKLAPDSLDILQIYAFALHNAGDIKEALELYLRILEKNPEDLNTLNNIVSIYGVLEDLENALLYSEKLLVVDSTFEDAYFNIGTIYLQQIQAIDFCLDSLKDTTGVYRTDQQSKVRREDLQKNRRELLAKAESKLVKAVAFDTLDLEARLLLAQVYLQQDKLDPASEVLEFLIQRDSTDCEALAQLAGVYAKKGIGDKAKDTWQKAQDCLKEEE